MQGLSELPVLLTVIKMGTAVLMVVALSVLAEAVSPRFAGIISGFPLGAAISLFFLGFDMGPGFAAQSALYTMLGLVATLVFAHGYYRCSQLAENLSKGSNLLLASTVSVAGYFLAAWGLHFLQASLTVSLVLPTVAIFLFHYRFRKIEDVMIEEKVRLDGTAAPGPSALCRLRRHPHHVDGKNCGTRLGRIIRGLSHDHAAVGGDHPLHLRCPPRACRFEEFSQGPGLTGRLHPGGAHLLPALRHLSGHSDRLRLCYPLSGNDPVLLG